MVAHTHTCALDMSKKLKSINPPGRYAFQSITVFSNSGPCFPFLFSSQLYFMFRRNGQLLNSVYRAGSRGERARSLRCAARVSNFRINVPNIPVRIDAHDGGSINNQSATIMPGRIGRIVASKTRDDSGMVGRWRQLPTTRAILRIASIAVWRDGAARCNIYCNVFRHIKNTRTLSGAMRQSARASNPSSAVHPDITRDILTNIKRSGFIALCPTTNVIRRVRDVD